MTQSMKKQLFKNLSTSLLIMASALWLAGCGSSEQATHSHDGEAHDHDHADATTTEVMGAVADATAAVAQVATETAYPLKTCVVSGEELGSMGEAVSYEHEGTLIKVCCDHCLPDVKKDPAKFVAMVKQATSQP